jgi:putative acyl-CoA dehydrogenase
MIDYPWANRWPPRRLEGLLPSAADEQDVINQPPPFAGLNLFTSDPALGAVLEGVPHAVADGLAAHGASWGSPDTFELGRIANQSPPVLKTHSPTGARIDSVEFHPAYHALMRRSVAGGLHCSVWDAEGEEAQVRSVARAARFYMTAKVESGHLSSIGMTSAGVAALAQTPALFDAWLPLIQSRQYDSSRRWVAEKSGATLGLAVTEKQGGSDLGGGTSEAEDTRDGTWRLRGHKWFVSAPMSDAFLVLENSNNTGFISISSSEYFKDSVFFLYGI